MYASERMAGDNSGGVIFYFNSGTLNVDSNSGSSCSAAISTTASLGTGQLQFGVKCTAASQVPANLPATITGNLLMGPCTGPYGDPLGTDDPIGEQHGMYSSGIARRIWRQPAPSRRGVAVAQQHCWDPCTFIIATHRMELALEATAPLQRLLIKLTLQGDPGSTSYIVGNIVTDQLGSGGHTANLHGSESECAVLRNQGVTVAMSEYGANWTRLGEYRLATVSFARHNCAGFAGPRN